MPEYLGAQMPMFKYCKQGPEDCLIFPKSTTKMSVRRKSFSLFPSLLLRVQSFPSLHRELIFCPSLYGVLLLSSEIGKRCTSLPNCLFYLFMTSATLLIFVISVLAKKRHSTNTCWTVSKIPLLSVCLVPRSLVNPWSLRAQIFFEKWICGSYLPMSWRKLIAH